jgi:hypothetical protein
MNNLPVNDEMDLIRKITSNVNLNEESVQLTEEELALLNEAPNLRQILAALRAIGSRAGRFFKKTPESLRSDNVSVVTPEIPTPTQPGLPPTPPTGITPVKIEPLPPTPQAITPVAGRAAPSVSQGRNIGKGIADLALAASIGGLAYLGSKQTGEKPTQLTPSEMGMKPVQTQASATSTTGVTDPDNKTWVPSGYTPPKSNYAPVIPVTPTPAPVSAPKVVRTSATSVTSTFEPAPEPDQTKPAVSTPKPVDRFAAEREKATPEQRKQVEDNARRLGVQPWTQEHYDAVGKSVEQRKKAIETANQEIAANQRTMSAGKTPDGGKDSGRDTSNIVPGSQMWGELSAQERSTVRDRYARGEGPSISVRYNKETGKFDEPGYGDQGRYGDIVKALNMNESVQKYCNYINESMGINQAAYGFTPKGGRKVNRLAKRYEQEPMASWSGDSTTEAPDLEPESKERPHIDDVVAPHISTLIAAADKAQIDLGHGEAFDPRSRDHQRLLKMSKDPAVMKASQAIQQIRKDYGVE